MTNPLHNKKDSLIYYTLGCITGFSEYGLLGWVISIIFSLIFILIGAIILGIAITTIIIICLPILRHLLNICGILTHQ